MTDLNYSIPYPVIDMTVTRIGKPPVAEGYYLYFDPETKALDPAPICVKVRRVHRRGIDAHIANIDYSVSCPERGELIIEPTSGFWVKFNVSYEFI